MGRRPNNIEMMTIRVPKSFANELYKLRKDEELPTIAAALRFYLENMEKSRLEEMIKAELEKMRRSIQTIAQELIRHLAIDEGHITEYLTDRVALERIAGEKGTEKTKIKKGKASKDHIT
ncbi:hypothetical protein ES702_01683 [subsurface metagenome]